MYSQIRFISVESHLWLIVQLTHFYHMLIENPNSCINIGRVNQAAILNTSNWWTEYKTPTYKRLLCLCISPDAWGAWVRIAGSIGTHPHFSSLAIWGSPLLLSHSAQTAYSSQLSVVGQARILWSVLRAPGPACHAWRKQDERGEQE